MRKLFDIFKAKENEFIDHVLLLSVVKCNIFTY